MSWEVYSAMRYSRRLQALFLLHVPIFCFVFGLVLLLFGTNAVVQAQTGIQLTDSFKTPGFDDNDIRVAVGLLLQFIEGAFGALVMVVAGLLSIIAAAMGSFKTSLTMLIVGVGAYILRSLVSLFFGTNFYVSAQ